MCEGLYIFFPGIGAKPERAGKRVSNCRVVLRQQSIGAVTLPRSKMKEYDEDVFVPPKGSTSVTEAMYATRHLLSKAARASYSTAPRYVRATKIIAVDSSSESTICQTVGESVSRKISGRGGDRGLFEMAPRDPSNPTFYLLAKMPLCSRHAQSFKRNLVQPHRTFSARVI